MHMSIGEMKNDLCRRGKIPAANPTGECEIYMLGYTYSYACMHRCTRKPPPSAHLLAREVDLTAGACHAGDGDVPARHS